MRRAFIVSVIVGLALALAIREYRLHRRVPLEEAYIGGQGATVWNSTAQIRLPVANLAYGQPVQIYQRDADNVLVSTPAGVRGWVSSVSLMDPDIWRRVALLAETTKSMPVQAVGRTRARANLHTRPGRQSPVILEAPDDSPVIVLQHAEVASQRRPLDADAGPPQNSEDWWLVRASVKDAGDVSGWVLGRLVSLDLPEPLPEYQSSEAMTIVAWFEINRVKDPSSNGYRPDYLVAGTRGPQGGCDFTLTRVYTWSVKRHRYETAFLDSRLCGKLPVDVTPAKIPGGDAYFRFQNLGANGVENRAYDMKLTTVHRMDVASRAAQRKTLRQNERPSPRRSHS
ncbi:MAG: hypothetical protein WA020_00905 [Candidatus Acidiferrales bacterium]